MKNRLFEKGQLIDLHIHTQYSDGMYSVPELLALAEKRGLEVICFTDHDMLYANNEVKSLGKKSGFSGRVLTGCEIACSFNGKKYEVLAYDFDLAKLEKFQALTLEFQFALEEERLEKLKERGESLGFEMTPNLKFNPKYRTAHKTFFHDIAKFDSNKELYKKYQIDRADNLYRDHMVIPGSLFHCYNVVTETPSIELVCKKIHDAGGLAIFAHAFEVYGEKDPKQLVRDLHALKILDGFECIHKKFKLEDCIWLYSFCVENNLIFTGGSDFHGDGFRVKGKPFSPEHLGFVERPGIEVRFPILKTEVK